MRPAEATPFPDAAFAFQQVLPPRAETGPAGLPAEPPAATRAHQGPPAGRLQLGEETFEIREPEATIGRDPGSEIQVADPAVSWSHAQLTRYGGHLYLRDLGSRNGTFVNAELVTTPRLLRDGDVIHAGNTDLTFAAAGPALDAGAPAPAQTTTPARLVPSLAVAAGPLAGRTISLGSLPLVIGRNEAPGTFGTEDRYVSHRHLEVLRGPEGGLLAKDLGSTNGSRLNGRKLEPGRPEPLQSGDRLQLGPETVLEVE